jgi:hypothetical protein
MKRSITIAFFGLITLLNCSVHNNNDDKDHVIKTNYHLIQVNGGIAEVDTTFDFNKIIWTFVLTVNNTNTNDVEGGLDTGTYSYSIEENDAKDLFLIIESNEFGGFTFTQTQLKIDQNLTTSGNGADGFIHTFVPISVVEN